MDQNLVQEMPVVLLNQWRCLTPSPNDDLVLMDTMLQDGIIEPIVLGIGAYSRKIRLDSGNHKIYLAPRLGLTHLPVIARVWNYCTFTNGNGDHSYDCPEITVEQEWIEEDYYARPSDVLDIMSLLVSLIL